MEKVRFAFLVPFGGLEQNARCSY